MGAALFRLRPTRAGGGLALPGCSRAAAAERLGPRGALPGLPTFRLGERLQGGSRVREARGLQGGRAQGESRALWQVGKQEDAEGPQIPGRMQGRAGLDQCFLLPRLGPCPQSPSSTVAGTMLHGSGPDMSPHVLLSTTPHLRWAR